MITRLQTRWYRSLKGVDQRLGEFQALVGPNASGKTTFLDVIAFFGDLMRNRGDVVETVQARSRTFQKLVWKEQGDAFQLAIEAEIPDSIRQLMSDDKSSYTHVRYEVEVGLDSITNEIGLNHENLWLATELCAEDDRQQEIFPLIKPDPPSLLSEKGKKGIMAAIRKTPGGNDNYYPDGRSSYKPSFKLGRGRSALANIPADEKSFPASLWFRRLLESGVQLFVLNSQIIRQPSPPGQGLKFRSDGSNLPWVIAELRQDPERFRNWLDHVRTALEDVRDISTVERQEDRHRYLVVEYDNGARVPSWLVSDGTLRLLALTITAYVPKLEGIFLIEEPENGIHPQAIDTVLQSLSSMYDSQVLVTTHSPVVLNMLESEQVLCFAKDDEGATDIVSGDNHPALRTWREGAPDLGILFAAGILS